MTNDRSQQLIDAIHAGVLAGVQEGSLLIENDAKRLSPVKTGNNRRSIHTEIEDGPVITGKTGPATDYGIFLEFGTVRMAPRPYMRPAFESNKGQVTALIIQHASEAAQAALGGGL